ncbi:protein PAXX isoform X2 [Numida meleagris]|uniref:protein PAXX isoform X2 n=1 Tax=Numida meleagris TaxID=8996 RepID=UPI000B3DB312|nr:protein PAXX isoform X2 [Numida meleagris]
MAEPSGPFWVLRDGSGRYLCYCRPAPGPGSAATVLAALGRGAVSLGLRDGTATLRLWEGHEALLLPRLPAAEARPQLQALLFAMAARVRDLEERLEVLGTLGSSYSLEKSTTRSQQPVLPGEQFWGVCCTLVCFLFLRRLLGPGTPWGADPPLLWLLPPPLSVPSLAQEGPGSARWLLRCPVHHGAGQCARLQGKAGVDALLDWRPWQLLWAFLTCCVCRRCSPDSEGPVGLPEPLADLLLSLSLPFLAEADPSPRKNRAAGSALPAKRKIPGESLINPGFKSKSAPSGVDFEDS